MIEKLIFNEKGLFFNEGLWAIQDKINEIIDWINSHRDPQDTRQGKEGKDVAYPKGTRLSQPAVCVHEYILVDDLEYEICGKCGEERGEE